MTKFLRERVKESIRAGYHQSTERWLRGRLLGLRARDDKGFGAHFKQVYGRDMAASEYDQPSFFPGDDNSKVGKPPVKPVVKPIHQGANEWWVDDVGGW